MNELDALQSYLISLRLEFDKAITDGKTFTEVKIIQSKIKQLERDLTSYPLQHIR